MRVLRRAHQVLLGFDRGRRLVVGDLQLADDLRLQQVHRRREVRLRCRPVGALRGRGALLRPGRRIRPRHGLRVHRAHEALEVVLAHRGGLDHHALQDPADVVERDDVARIGHRERQAVVDERDRHAPVRVDERLRQQREHARIDLQPRQADELDAGVAIGSLEPLGHHAREREGDFRVVLQGALEVGALEHGARGGLKREDTRGARLPGDEGHLPEHLPRAELGQHELDAGIRVLVTDGDEAAHDQERGVPRTALAHDQLLGRELAPPHA